MTQSSAATAASTDRFGNQLAPGLPYARGRMLSNGADEHVKLREARRHIRQRLSDAGDDGLFNLSGLERGMTAQLDVVYNDEITPALVEDDLRRAAVDHLGGSLERHDFALLNRQSAALLAALMVLTRPGDRVVGISPDYTHPAVTRPTGLLGATFVDTTSVDQLAAAVEAAPTAVVVVTRLAVSYRALSGETVIKSIQLAREHGARVLVDDAGGARVAPAVFGQPKMLELDVDLGSTGLDKYGTYGPRFGLLGGRKDLVAEVISRAYEYGLEARPMLYPAALESIRRYDPERVRALRDTTMVVAAELQAIFGDRVGLTEVSAQIRHEDVLEAAMDRAGLNEAPIAPYEATAAVAMLLLRDHGALTVHFAGLPPGTAGLLFKFISPEELERFGGAAKLARAVDNSIDQVSEMLSQPEQLRELLLGVAEG